MFIRQQPNYIESLGKYLSTRFGDLITFGGILLLTIASYLIVIWIVGRMTEMRHGCRND